METSNSFANVLQNQRKGGLLAELSELMQQAVLASREHMASATLVLKLTVTPASGDGAALSVADEITVKLPKERKPSSLFYATDDGALVREDPNQHELTLRVTSHHPVAGARESAADLSQQPSTKASIP